MQRDDIESIVRQAGQLALDYFHRRGSLTVEMKHRQDLVSEADWAVEQFLRARIRELFPQDAILGEEYGFEPVASDISAPSVSLDLSKPSEFGQPENDAVWVIDPIDGTTNFLRGIPEFAVTLCRVVQGEPQQGYIYQPSKDEMLSAVYQQGAWFNGQPYRINPNPVTPETALLGIGYGLKSDCPERAIAMLTQWTDAGCLSRQVGSAAVGLCMAILGQTDGFYEPFLNSWDALAGQLIAVETGLNSSSFLCGEKLMTGGAVWVSRPELFDLVVLEKGKGKREKGKVKKPMSEIREG
ncbi:hypothetical protein BTA51_02355 [Hahella sp. CCB-MM4]|uniref:inositol monophosphatase family protein n=1 Tax=Hahella sp. (strain CCB-MM4) TaxID=1926491 RepID=UPI000B9C19DE|nr:inositol monophosphatase family protein [Hahella sp. CCB-MM4]OZG75246.1 hypothetical protein BTA51_02355 [Hahella sp. CCB-MM4]